MKKIIEIEGMSCNHCADNAAKALNSIDGVKAKVNLSKNNAIVKLDKEIKDNVFKDALSKVNLEVVSITEKKGLFK